MDRGGRGQRLLLRSRAKGWLGTRQGQIQGHEAVRGRDATTGKMRNAEQTGTAGEMLVRTYPAHNLGAARQSDPEPALARRVRVRPAEVKGRGVTDRPRRSGPAAHDPSPGRRFRRPRRKPAVSAPRRRACAHPLHAEPTDRVENRENSLGEPPDRELPVFDRAVSGARSSRMAKLLPQEPRGQGLRSGRAPREFTSSVGVRARGRRGVAPRGGWTRPARCDRRARSRSQSSTSVSTSTALDRSSITSSSLDAPWPGLRPIVAAGPHSAAALWLRRSCPGRGASWPDRPTSRWSPALRRPPRRKRAPPTGRSRPACR